MESKRTKVMTITIKDCKVQTFRAGGSGGQNQNKRDTGVRIIHTASGARGESREARTQLENKKLAWRRMGESKEFRGWVRVEHARRCGAIDQAVKAAMHPANLDIEFYDPLDANSPAC